VSTITGEELGSSDADIRLKRQMIAAAKVLDSILTSSGPAELCRQIVHSDYVPGSTRGCEIFYLDSKSIIRSVAKYGLGAGHSDGVSAWDNHPAAEAIREMKITAGDIHIDGKSLGIIAVPFVTNGVPVGLISLILEERFPVSISLEMSELFFKLGAFYLESLDFGGAMSSIPSGVMGKEELTSRQLVILSHIEKGMVNLEIAKILMLSESTIRQETVKIYRSLGVGNRHEAVKKARVLGLIARNAPSKYLEDSD